MLNEISKNLLVVYRESVNLIGYITRRLSAVSKIQLTIIPLALIASESIAHSAFGLMGY